MITPQKGQAHNAQAISAGVALGLYFQTFNDSFEFRLFHKPLMCPSGSTPNPVQSKNFFMSLHPGYKRSTAARMSMRLLDRQSALPAAL
jgi:hypothetical protein